MDQNLTGLVAINVALIQPWYVLIINTLIGPISAFIGAGAALYTIRRTQKHEKARALREERNKVYSDFLYFANLVTATDYPKPEKDAAALMKAAVKLQLYGSQNVLKKAQEFDAHDDNKIRALVKELIPLMADELQK